MATEVLLMADVADLGVEGDVVKVAVGYARNYLLPKGLAAPVSEATRRRLTKRQAEREVARAAAMSEARSLVARFKGVSCTITVKTGEGEKLYGSVGATEVVDSLKAQGIEVARHQVDLEHPLKDLGVYDVKIKLHPDVDASVKVWVVEE